MVPGAKLVKELVNVPIPVPSTVLGLTNVGLDVVLLQQTPREVIVAPLSLITLPPLIAVAREIKVAVVVDEITGIAATVVVKDFTSL